MTELVIGTPPRLKIVSGEIETCGWPDCAKNNIWFISYAYFSLSTWSLTASAARPNPSIIPVNIIHGVVLSFPSSQMPKNVKPTLGKNIRQVVSVIVNKIVVDGFRNDSFWPSLNLRDDPIRIYTIAKLVQMYRLCQDRIKHPSTKPTRTPARVLARGASELNMMPKKQSR